MTRPASTFFLLALAARAVLLAGALLAYHGDLDALLTSSDAPSYVAMAELAVSGVRPDNIWHERVFLGWPLSFALPGLVMGQALACVLLGVLLAALVPGAWWKLTGDRASSLALIALTPTWLMHSSIGMSEPALLLYQVLALLAFRRGADATASLWAAAAMVVRPHGVAVWLAIAYGLARRKLHRELLVHTAVAGAATLAILALNQGLFGDPLRQAHMYSDLPNVGAVAGAAIRAGGYGGGHLGPPLLHLLITPWLVPVPLWKVVFIWLHLGFVLAACGVGLMVLRRDGLPRWGVASAAPRDDEQELHTLLLLWAALDTVFILCTGPYWGFHSFDRYAVWALPAYLYLLRRYLPRRDAQWAVLGLVSVALTLWKMSRGG